MKWANAMATGVLVGYLLMIGVTHGYIVHREPDCRSAHGWELCNYQRGPERFLGSLFWPLWWTSHATQEALK